MMNNSEIFMQTKIPSFALNCDKKWKFKHKRLRVCVNYFNVASYILARL